MRGRRNSRNVKGALLDLGIAVSLFVVRYIALQCLGHVRMIWYYKSNPPTPWSPKAKGKARGEAVHGRDTKVRHELRWSGEAYLALRS